MLFVLLCFVLFGRLIQLSAFDSRSVLLFVSQFIVVFIVQRSERALISLILIQY